MIKLRKPKGPDGAPGRMYHMTKENGNPSVITVTCDVEHPDVGQFFFRWKIVNNRLAQVMDIPAGPGRQAVLQAMMKKEILKRVEEMKQRPVITTEDPGLDEEVDLPL